MKMRDILDLLETQDRRGVDVEQYYQGDCHLFAMALNRAFGFPMIFIWDVDPHDDDLNPLGFEVLHHAVCRRPDGTFVDASGTVTMQDALSGHGDATELVPRETTPERAKAAMRGKRGLRRPEQGEMERLVAYVIAHADAYREDSDINMLGLTDAYRPPWL